MAFIDALEPRWSGALPASFVYDREGKLVESWQGRVSYDTFEKRILNVLGENVGG